MHRKGRDEPDERRVELAVGEVRAGAHARAGAVAVVRGAGAFAQLEVALGDEAVGHFEVVFVVVGCPGVLDIQIVSKREDRGGDVGWKGGE